MCFACVFAQPSSYVSQPVQLVKSKLNDMANTMTSVVKNAVSDSVLNYELKSVIIITCIICS
jgi:hypothetical protein